MPRSAFKIRNGCSYHGVSLNVQMDLSPFLRINPCGYAGLETVDMATAGATVPVASEAGAAPSTLGATGVMNGAVTAAHYPEIARRLAAACARCWRRVKRVPRRAGMPPPRRA